AVGARLLHARVRLGAIPPGFDVDAAREHQSVQTRDDRAGHLSIRVHARRDQHSDPAGALDLGHVVVGQQGVRHALPHPAHGFLDVTGDADDRPRAIGVHGLWRSRDQNGVTYAPVIPPSTMNCDAVMKLDSSLARNSTALAISSGSANRPTGMWARRRAARSRSVANSSWSSGVLTGPGQSALTRTPCRANCTPSSRDIDSTPPLLAG